MKTMIVTVFAIVMCRAEALSLRGQPSLAEMAFSLPQNSSGKQDEDLKVLEDMEEKMMHMAKSRNDGTPLKGFADLIKPHLDSMINSINNAHKTDQTTLDGLGTAFTTCGTAQSTTKSEASSLETTMKSNSKTHKDCRTAESTAQTNYANCVSTMDSLKTAKKTSCDAYNLANKVPNIDLVPKPGVGASYRSWLVSVKDWVIAELNSLDKAKSACDSATTNYDNKKNECEGANGSGGLKKAHKDKKSACDASQVTLESTSCSHAAKAESACSQYGVCYVAAKNAYDTGISNLLQAQKARVTEYGLVQRLICYCGLFAAADGKDLKGDDIDKCKNKQHDTTHLELKPVTVPAAPAACSPVAMRPCTSTYLTTEYGSLPPNAKPTSCQPCPGGPVATVTKMIYKEGKTGNGVDETITDSVSLVPNVEYTVAFEVLRNDLGGASEYVKNVKVGDQSLGACHPDGGDYDCTYFSCPFQEKTVSTQTGTLALTMTNTGHSWDCDCDKNTWECSKESTVSGRSAMKMVGRFTFTPKSGFGVEDVTCDFTVDNYVTKVYIDGTDKTSSVSGNLNSWPTKKSIAFKSSVSKLAFQVNDAEQGCRNGGFAISCRSKAPAWTMSSNSKANWKVFSVKAGGSPSSISANQFPPMAGGKQWYETSYPEGAGFKEPRFGSTTYADGVVKTDGKNTQDFCGGDSDSTKNHWFFTYKSPFMPLPVPVPAVPSFVMPSSGNLLLDFRGDAGVSSTKWTDQANQAVADVPVAVKYDTAEKAWLFPGKGSVITVPMASNPQKMTAVTYAGWVKPLDYKGTLGWVLTQYRDFGWSRSITMSDGRLGGTGVTPGGYNSGLGNLPLNQWSHIAGVWTSRGGDCWIYANMKKYKRTCSNGQGNNNNEKFIIGGRGPNDSGHNAKVMVTDVGLWSKALTENEISTLYNNGKRPSQAR